MTPRFAITHTETREYAPATVLLAHVLASPEAARWARVRIDPAWLGDRFARDAWSHALDSAALGPDALRARFHALEGGAFLFCTSPPNVAAVWAEAWAVPAAVLRRVPVRRVARLARDAYLDRLARIQRVRAARPSVPTAESTAESTAALTPDATAAA